MAEKALSTYLYSDYLEVEAGSDLKYEFHDGMITAMAGGTIAHGKISLNVAGEIRNELKKSGKSCDVFGSDVKIRIESANRTFYPDASVTCGDTQVSDIDKHAITNPVLIVEVLSESTAAFDLGPKFTHYRELESLREYVVVSQEQVMVTSYYRTPADLWEINTVVEWEGSVTLQSLGCEIRMKDLYSRVEGIDPEVG